MAAPELDFRAKLNARRKQLKFQKAKSQQGFMKGQVARTLRPSTLQGVRKPAPPTVSFAGAVNRNPGPFKPSGQTPPTKPGPGEGPTSPPRIPPNGNTGPMKPKPPKLPRRPGRTNKPIPRPSGPQNIKRNPVRNVPTSSYTFKKGDTLSGIAKSKFGDADIWHRIVNHNPNLKGVDPRKIPVGTKINLPSEGNKYRRHLSRIQKKQQPKPRKLPKPKRILKKAGVPYNVPGRQY